MTKTPMMAPNNSSVHFASLDPRADPPPSDQVVEHAPMVAVKVRAQAGLFS